MAKETLDHFCPGCGKPQKFFARYPWYFCVDCVEFAEDVNGRRLVFFNLSASGGFGWAYADDPEKIMTPGEGQLICLINKRRVIVGEARFGGIVCEPYYIGIGDIVDISVSYDVHAIVSKMISS